MILITSLLIIVWVQNTEHWSKHMERIMSKKILFIMTVLMISLSWKRITGQSENGRLKTIRSCLAMKKQPMALDHLKICLIQFRAAIHIRPSAKFQILCQLQKISASLMMTDLWLHKKGLPHSVWITWAAALNFVFSEIIKSDHSRRNAIPVLNAPPPTLKLPSRVD